MLKGLPEIDGWEYTGEWREAQAGDGYINCASTFCLWDERDCASVGKYPILHRRQWRAESGSRYYYINTCFEVNTVVECGASSDNTRYHVGNYFQTEQEVGQARERVIKALKGEE